MTQDAALQFLKEYGIDGPPVPAKKLLKKISRLFWFSKVQREEFAKEDGFTRLTDNGYLTYINDGLIVGRDNFTYLHEAGHIFLGHHEDFDIDLLTPWEKWVLNREADIFAANVLMSEAWIMEHARLPITVRELGRLKCIFGASWTAIINRLDELHLCSKDHCYALFNNENASQVCETGVTYEATGIITERLAVLTTANHCTLMYSKARKILLMPPKAMAIPSTGANGRFLECPVCSNSNFSPIASHCTQCGTLLFNQCTNTRQSVDVRCGHVNPADARFCECCGAETTLYRLSKNAKKVVPINLIAKYKTGGKNK